MPTMLYIKQKLITFGGEKFTVTDAQGRVCYNVKGSFLSLHKRFHIYAGQDQSLEVATIEKKIISLLPHFSIQMDGREVATIDKKLTLFKDKYRVSAAGLDVDGDIWNLNFNVLRGGRAVARIHQRMLSWGDTYEVTIYDNSLEALIVSMVITIDYVKFTENLAESNMMENYTPAQQQDL